MIPRILTAAAITVLFSCNNEKAATSTSPKEEKATAMNTLSAQEKKDGWELLFDGSSTKGWHQYGNLPVGAAWKASDGLLYLDPASKKKKEDGGDILTDNEYENYELRLEWRVDSGANSGIIFNIHEDKSKYEWGYMTGPEMQVLDNAAHPDAKIRRHRAGDLYDLISCNRETVKPAGEWNFAVIRVNKGKLDLSLNNETVVSTTMWDDNWKQLIAGSKFKNIEGFGTYRKGRIALQDHGDRVWFRNIKIKQL